MSRRLRVSRSFPLTLCSREAMRKDPLVQTLRFSRGSLEIYLLPFRQMSLRRRVKRFRVNIRCRPGWQLAPHAIQTGDSRWTLSSRRVGRRGLFIASETCTPIECGIGILCAVGARRERWKSQKCPRHVASINLPFIADSQTVEGWLLRSQHD